MLNLSSLFYSTAESPTLLGNLDLTAAAEQDIQEAKQLIRQCLRDGLPAVLKAAGYTGPSVSPRFFTQGSAAYGTLNAPAHIPPQQADIDDGAYLPLSFVAQERKPSVASSVFFLAVETTLAPLAKLRDWTIVKDKPTCVRIVISSTAHVDVPLYAIPDTQFHTLQKAALNSYSYMALDEASVRADQDAWTALPTDEVLLAHREENWKKSDPRPLKKWFLEEVDKHGEQYRRVVRYLKAFRDFRWITGGPASVLLMVAVAPIFEARDRRDDIALLDVVTKLPAILRKGVNNPIDPAESLSARLGPAGIEDTIAKLAELENHLRGAIHGTAAQACAWMIKQFGTRFPNASSRVKVVSVAATVLAAPATVSASPLVGRTQAG